MNQQAFASAMRVNRMPRERCMHPVTWDATKLPARAAIEIKYDGLCAIGTAAELGTREGVPLDCAAHLVPALTRIAPMLYGLGTVFHGEYVNAAGVNAAIGDFQRRKGTGGIFLFDAVPLDVWLGRAESEPLSMRRRRLETISKAIDGTGLYLAQHSVMPMVDDEMVELAAGHAWDAQLEGIVVKDLDSPYVRAASDAWMKIKRIETFDATVYEASEPNGRLDWIMVDGPNGRPVKLARGFSEAERLIPCSQWLGQVVEFKHYGVLPSGAYKSATYLRRRDDKMGRR